MQTPYMSNMFKNPDYCTILNGDMCATSLLTKASQNNTLLPHTGLLGWQLMNHSWHSCIVCPDAK